MSMDCAELAKLLWPKGSGPSAPQAYMLLDGARDKRIVPMVRSSGVPFECLYAGPLTPALMAAAPYIVQLSPESRFFNQVVPRAFGNAWGMFAVARPDVTLQALRRHYRTLLRVQDENGRVLAFRFYDPRVLRIYLPTCTAQERSRFFGPVQSLAWENEAGDALVQQTLRAGARESDLLERA
jgi:hypothetical protein